MDKLDILKEENFNKMIEDINELDGFANDIGIKILSISKGYAKAEINIYKKHLNPGNSVHGGCIFTLADSVGGLAAWSRGSYVATVSSNINYLNPAIECNKLIGTAREIKYGKKLSVYEVEIYDEKDRLIAKATNTYYNLGKK